MNIVITGAGRGLGLEMVRRHLALGDKVWALAHSMTAELKACKCRDLSVIECELTDYDSIIGIAKKIDSAIDVLYNIAGLYYEDQRVGIEETDISKALKMYEVNALAPLNVMKAFYGHMHSGSVNLIVSSEAGSIGECERSEEYGYCMSKAAVNMAARIFSNATLSQNITTILYHPGWMRTQMGGKRAAASPYSIEASESADRLIEIVSKALENPDLVGADKKSENSDSPSTDKKPENSDSSSTDKKPENSDLIKESEVMFIDYTGKEWNW